MLSEDEFSYSDSSCAFSIMTVSSRVSYVFRFINKVFDANEDDVGIFVIGDTSIFVSV